MVRVSWGRLAEGGGAEVGGSVGGRSGSTVVGWLIERRRSERRVSICGAERIISRGDERERDFRRATRLCPQFRHAHLARAMVERVLVGLSPLERILCRGPLTAARALPLQLALPPFLLLHLAVGPRPAPRPR